MNTAHDAPRLHNLTALLDDDQQRQAFLLTAVTKHVLGASAQDDPDLVDNFLSQRRVSSPVARLVKAAVAALDSSSSLAAMRPMVQAFIGAVNRVSVLGRLDAVRVPTPNAIGAVQVGVPTAHWIGEQVAKPLSSLSFANTSLAVLKSVADVPVTSELLRFANGDALRLLERATVSAVATALDVALLDPANAGTADVMPPSLTNGLVALTPDGDFQTQVGKVLSGISGGAPTRPVLIVSLQTALRLTALRDLESIGVRVIVTPAAGSNLIAVDADRIAYCDDGGSIRVGEPDVQLDDSPTTPSTASTVLVSSWQRDLKIIRGERWANWAKRSDAAAFMEVPVNWPL